MRRARGAVPSAQWGRSVSLRPVIPGTTPWRQSGSDMHRRQQAARRLQPDAVSHAPDVGFDRGV